MKENLQKNIHKSLSISCELERIKVDFTDDFSHGEYTTNVALVLSKELGKSSREVAEDIVNKLNEAKIPNVEKIEVAGAGFINFFIKKEYFAEKIAEIISEGNNFGKGGFLKNKEILFEYTDPNPFKAFHIGHLMANAIGESLSRLAEFQGAQVKRICYGGDVGLHVAKTIWGMIQAKAGFPHDEDSLADKVKFLGDAYVVGNTAYEENEEAKKEIKEINKKVFARNDPEVQIYYDKGRMWSLEQFEKIYKKLGSRFDKYFFESETIQDGVEVVKKNKNKIFVESEGAVVFKGEDFGLHTRVFLTAENLPTYETKEIGLFYKKIKEFPDHDISITVTANEQNDYFKVLSKVFSILEPEASKKFTHVSHGILRFAEGKMSSRKGNIITGESLIADMEELSLEKLKERELSGDDKKEIAEAVAVSSIKYSILKVHVGKDIIFDKEKSLSFEGDSGPYLQYAYVRTESVLKKANDEGVRESFNLPNDWKTTVLEKYLERFPEVATRAWTEKAPQIVAEYLMQTAGAFSSFYASEQIVSKDVDSPYKLALTKAFGQIMKNGLNLLGIKIVEKM